MQFADKDRSPLLPDRHPTQDFFVCDIFDAAPKGDMASMEHPIFSLSTKPDHRVRNYEHGTTQVAIKPSADGLATIHDRDVLIYCISHLIAAINEGREISQNVRFKAYDLLKATNRMTNGQGYEALKAAFERLAGTRISTNIVTGGKEVFETFGLIERARIVRETRDGRMQEVEVKLSDWVFNAIRHKEVLTLHRDYFRLRKPLERRIYELARKHCGKKNEWKISLELLQKKCGSVSTLKEFRRLVGNIVEEDRKHHHLPDYAITLDDSDMVNFHNRGTMPLGDLQQTKIAVRSFDPEVYHDAKNVAPGWDVYYLEQEWRDWITEPPRDPEAARLAKALREELGYSIQRDGRHWDIAGIPRETKVKFSRRTTEIEALAKDKGLTDPKEIAALGAKTRNTKTTHESFAGLQQAWRERLDPAEAELFPNLADASQAGTVNGTQTATAAIQQALQHCFEREAVVPERKVLAEALRMGVGIIDVNEVHAEAEQQGLLSSEIGGRRLATTPEVLAEEQAVLKFARAGRDSVAPLNSDWQPTESWLSAEQTAAIEQLAGSSDRLQLLVGGAGTGKTTLMQQAVAAINAGGHQVFTFAPSAEASRKVLRDEGFDTATTVAELLVNTKLQAATAGQVLWIDEASLLGSRQLKQVFDLAERNDSRVILSGDWKRQHGSVERGGVLGLLDRYAGITPIQIHTIRRQHGQYKDAIATMAQGDLLAGFDQLDQLGWVHELDDTTRDLKIANDFADAVQKGKSAMVLSPTHREAAHLTQAIRSTLRERGHIDPQERQVTILQPRHLTEGERRSAAFLQQGDVIVFQQNARGYRKGERITVEDSVPESITEQADRFAVYRPSSIALSVGDRVRITAGGKTQDGQHRLNTGSVFEVADINEHGDLKFSNGWVVDADFGLLSYGWVSTSHASQGRTVDHVFVAESAESLPAASREQLYVSASRGRHSAQFYTHDKTELRSAIAESSAKTSASELFWPINQTELHRNQQLAVTKDLREPRQELELACER